MATRQIRRLLVVDDEPQMLAAYRATFSPTHHTLALEAMGAGLFGGRDADPDEDEFDISYCTQGEEAVAAVEAAIAAGQPYEVMFLDMRMPPGIDGKETARRVRKLDEDLQIVLATGYSDHAPHRVAAVAGPIDKLFYLSKPFDRIEIRQLASSLCARWQLTQELKAAQVALTDKL